MARKKYIRRRIVKLPSLHEKFNAPQVTDQLADILATEQKRYKYVRFGITTDLKEEYDLRKQRDDIQWSSMKVYYSTPYTLEAEYFYRHTRNRDNYIPNNKLKFPIDIFEKYDQIYMYVMVGKRRKPMKDKNNIDKTFKFIDLFSGIGGFHLAMEAIGGECVFACDIDEDCRKTYETNYKIKPAGDITKITAEEIPTHDILCAGFPCQAFSKAGKRLGFDDETKGTLFFDICRILEYHKPKYALLENVRNLASHDGGNTWKVIHNKIESLGYNLLPEPVIFSPHYIGIPQHRERVYIMCIRKDLGELPQFIFDKKNPAPCTIESILEKDRSIKDIESYRISQEMEDLVNLWNEFIQNINVDKLPGFPIWAERLCNLNPIEDLSQYPTWKQNFILKNYQLYINNREFIDDWLVRAKQNPLFFGAKAKLEWQAGQTKHPDIWKQIFQLRPSGIRVKVNTYFPALVAIVQTSIVGSRKRFLTPRECARLQSFPDSFKYDTKPAQAYKQFGNAVNVKILQMFAQYMLNDPVIRESFTLGGCNDNYASVLKRLEENSFRYIAEKEHEELRV